MSQYCIGFLHMFWLPAGMCISSLRTSCNQNTGWAQYFHFSFFDMCRLFLDFLDETGSQCVSLRVELPTWVGCGLGQVYFDIFDHFVVP